MLTFIQYWLFSPSINSYSTSISSYSTSIQCAHIPPVLAHIPPVPTRSHSSSTSSYLTNFSIIITAVFPHNTVYLHPVVSIYSHFTDCTYMYTVKHLEIISITTPHFKYRLNSGGTDSNPLSSQQSRFYHPCEWNQFWRYKPISSALWKIWLPTC